MLKKKYMKKSSRSLAFSLISALFISSCYYLKYNEEINDTPPALAKETCTVELDENNKLIAKIGNTTYLRDYASDKYGTIQVKA